MRAQTLTSPVLPGEIAAPIVRTETGTLGLFSVGLRIGDELDDNALSDNRNKQANLLTLIEPHVGWSLSVPRAKWMLDYRPGFSVGHPLAIYNSRSQLLDTNLQFTPTRRITVRLRESVLQSKNVFDQLQQSELTPGSSVLDRPNNSILGTARENSEQAGADLTYAVTVRTAIGVSVAFYRANYSSALDTQPLGSAQSLSTHAFSSYRVTRHNWIGLDYNAQDLSSQQPQSRAFVQSVFYTHTLLLRPTMSVSFFAGPQHSRSHGDFNFPFAPAKDVSFAGANWTWAGGANYVWSGARSSLTIGLSRRISDGAGLQGIVELSTATAELKRQLTKRLQGKLLVADNRNRALSSVLAPLSSVSFAGGLSRALNQRLSLEFQYWHLHETSSVTQSNSYLADHNRLSLSLAYDFKTALQR